MIENKKIILASASPRRKELIALLCSQVEIRPAQCDETLPEGIGAKQAVEYLSKIKNDAARALCAEDEIVISADTVVAVENKILGKPIDKEDARRMISLLSGKTHQVYTGVTISLGNSLVTFSEKTDVTFFELTDEEIEAYVSSPEPYDKAGSRIWDTEENTQPEWADKAGAYGIQGKASLLVKCINGDYFNVVGLPVARLNRELNAFLKV